MHVAMLTMMMKIRTMVKYTVLVYVFLLKVKKLGNCDLMKIIESFFEKSSKK